MLNCQEMGRSNAWTLKFFSSSIPIPNAKFSIPNFMTTAQNPYGPDLGEREPIGAMRETVDRIRSLVAGWTPAQFERTYAPGKWTARQIMVHLAQTEMALGNRARMALSTPSYAAQAFDQ